MNIKYPVPMLASLVMLLFANVNAAPIEQLKINSDYVELAITPSVGGRLIHFSVPGRQNVLRIGKALQDQPQPVVSYFAEHIDYSGHIVWLGPQNDWWTYQTENQQRRDDKAPWPPDPYVVLAENKVNKATATQIILQGINSPISRVRLAKSFTLMPNKQQIELQATAKNNQTNSISRDIWFNTRVPTDAVVYVAVSSTDNIRYDRRKEPLQNHPVFSIENGFLQLKNPKLFPNNIKQRRGKLFIQPSAGWIAAFIHQQLFLIEFELNPQTSIHPEQGQVELYYHFAAMDASVGLIELEVHSPYQSILPNESISAKEWWSVYPYDGPTERNVQIDFIQQKLGAYGAHN